MSVKGYGSTLTAAAATLLEIVDEVEKEFKSVSKDQKKRLQAMLEHLNDDDGKKWLLCTRNDPVLEDAINELNAFELRTIGSWQFLERLLSGDTDLADFHVPDDDSVTAVRQRLASEGVKAYPVMRRTQGLIVARDNSLGVKQLKELAKPEVKFINRQRGAGTRQLLDKLLDAQGIAAQNINGYQREEYKHTAVATAILADTADVGVGLKSVAIEYGLGFISLGDETYFLVMSQQMIKRSAVSKLIRKIRAAASSKSGYEEVKLRQKK